MHVTLATHHPPPPPHRTSSPLWVDYCQSVIVVVHNLSESEMTLRRSYTSKLSKTSNTECTNTYCTCLLHRTGKVYKKYYARMLFYITCQLFIIAHKFTAKNVTKQYLMNITL